MQNSEVLALKYRPKRFEDLIGQASITQTLTMALHAKRLSHAYLFSGLRGSGKTSTARIFAKALVCEQGPTATPCETCTHCQMANSNRHMDIIEMDAASSRKIDDIRELIEHTKYKPASAQFKIFIIDEVHMLTNEAFNALLKTLEEPPSYIKFILATTDPLKLPATILSRTQHFRFKRISDTDIIHHIAHILDKENITHEHEALEILARSGNGSVRDTLTLLDQAIIYGKNRIDVATVTTMLGLIDPQFIAQLFDAIFAQNRPQILSFINELTAYESDLVIDELIVYLKQQLFDAKQTKFSTLLIERFFVILSDAKKLTYLNADAQFVLSLVFFKMVEALKLKHIDDVINKLESQTPKESQEAPTPTTQTPNIPKTPKAPDTFSVLRQKFYDRNISLGECFDKVVGFVSYEAPNLTLNMYGDGECLNELRKYYKDIFLPFVLQSYGEDTKLTFTKDAPPTAQDEEKKKSTITPPPNEQEPKPFDQSAILKDPTVLKAIELFGTKVTVQNKIATS